MDNIINKLPFEMFWYIAMYFLFAKKFEQRKFAAQQNMKGPAIRVARNNFW